MNAIVAGPDADDLAGALERQNVAVTTIDGVLTRERLEDAGMADAGLYVLTEMEQATSIALATELNEDARMVVYDRASLPEAVSKVTDLSLDPDLLDPDLVAEELTEAESI